MKKRTIKFNGCIYDLYEINAFGKHDVIAYKTEYLQGGLAIEILEYENNTMIPFGTLTANLDYPGLGPTFAFVKNYSENKGWAEELAKAIGGRPTGTTVHYGYVDLPLYDFSEFIRNAK